MCLKQNVRFITSYETKKTVIHKKAKANVIYKVTCSGCNEDYIEKTDLNLVKRLNDHASREDQTTYQHLSKSEHFAHIIGLHRLPDIDASTSETSNKQNFVCSINSNFCVLDTCFNWSQLLFSEALYIKNRAPKINDSLKVTRQLELFRQNGNLFRLTFGQWSL